MALKARDIMTKRVVTVCPETKVSELAKLLAGKRISGVPVVDESKCVVGIATEADLLARKRGQNMVKAIMTTQVVSVGEETPLEEIAALLARKKIKRVPVLRGGKLVGIVSRADVVRAIAGR
jgi:tRNA nucleotidyltransferase (CCA-adding enzyme)